MMRVTNSMIVKRTKTNINTNRAKVDYTNNQMSSQKKITKPSDNPIIAIRSLRLRSSLSTITQYVEHNIPDTESWLDCTQTALINMKDLVSEGYKQTVYGTNDSLGTADRQAILKELQSLQQQIYCEGNADYARRTVFTGYKTNQTLTFTDGKEALDEHYKIEERFDFTDIEKKNYYAGSFENPSAADLTGNPDRFDEVTLNRIRLAYDKLNEQQNTLSISYKNPNTDTTDTVTMSSDGTVISTQGCTFNLISAGNPPQDMIEVIPPDGYFVYPNPMTAADGMNQTTIYKSTDYIDNSNAASPGPPTAIVGVTNPVSQSVSVKYTQSANGNYLSTSIATSAGSVDISYRVTDTSKLKDDRYAIGPNEIVFDAENGELIIGDELAKAFDERKASFAFEYDKKGFDVGELRPEYYFDCTKYVENKEPIVYDNFDEKGKWKTQAIYYNIAGGQEMQINTEARDVFDSNIRRDIDEMIEIVQRAISAQETVDSIQAKIDAGEGNLTQLNRWLDAAKKQRDYANQNMHDTYSSYITKFQGYLDTVDLAITDLGGRGERVEMTKNRMNVQQSTFKELKSINEDMDLSELVINYTAASVAYQAALQAAAKIGKMTLLDFI